MEKSDWLGELFIQQNIIPEACSWFVVKVIKDFSNKKGVKIKDLEQTLKDYIYKANEEKSDFVFYFGTDKSLKDVLQDFVDEKILERYNDKYSVTLLGRDKLKGKSDLIEEYFPALGKMN